MTRNWAGISSETIGAWYETDAALEEWLESVPDNSHDFPPADHYFWSAWSAECALRQRDYEARAR